MATFIPDDLDFRSKGGLLRLDEAEIQWLTSLLQRIDCAEDPIYNALPYDGRAYNLFRDLDRRTVASVRDVGQLLGVEGYQDTKWGDVTLQGVHSFNSTTELITVDVQQFATDHAKWRRGSVDVDYRIFDGTSLLNDLVNGDCPVIDVDVDEVAWTEGN